MTVSSSNQSDPTQSVYSRMGRMIEEMMRELMREIASQQGLGNEVSYEHVQPSPQEPVNTPDFSDVPEAVQPVDPDEKFDDGLFVPDEIAIPIPEGIVPEAVLAADNDVRTPELQVEPPLSQVLDEPTDIPRLETELGIADIPLADLVVPSGVKDASEFVTVPVPSPPLPQSLDEFDDVQAPDIPEEEPDLRVPEFRDMPMDELERELDLLPLQSYVRGSTPEIEESLSIPRPASLPVPQPISDDLRRGFRTSDPTGFEAEQSEQLTFIESQSDYPSRESTTELMRKHEDAQRKFMEDLEQMFERLVGMWETANARIVSIESRLERTRHY